MLDISLRPIKDRVFEPVPRCIPESITPNTVTGIAFAVGLASCYCSATGRVYYSAILWLLNRSLDCVDGTLARQRKSASDLGGFLDLLGDFIIYALIPISCAMGLQHQGLTLEANTNLWLSVSGVEASYFINNFVLFYIAAIVEKSKASGDVQRTQELTSVAMRPALIEGFESGLLFTLMIALPRFTTALCLIMTLLVCIGTAQRVAWVVPVLSKSATRGKKE